MRIISASIELSKRSEDTLRIQLFEDSDQAVYIHGTYEDMMKLVDDITEKATRAQSL